MGTNPASRFICDRIFDAGIEHDPFARTVDKISIAAQCDLLTFPFPRCIDGSVRLHGNTGIQYIEPIYRSSLLCILAHSIPPLAAVRNERQHVIGALGVGARRFRGIPTRRPGVKGDLVTDTRNR
jgi:hypothetical protein